MSDVDFQTLLQFFKVLGDETRLKLLGLLANRDQSVEELAAQLHLKTPTVSHHLARLREAGFVGMRPEGNTHMYWLDAEALHTISKGLLSSGTMASLVDDQGGEVWERKVLRDFFDGSRLKEIPASRKKRLVVLKWLSTQFKYGERYPERVVNEIIQLYHEDASTLRRELISAHFMQRENGVYWRVESL